MEEMSFILNDVCVEECPPGYKGINENNSDSIKFCVKNEESDNVQCSENIESYKCQIFNNKAVYFKEDFGIIKSTEDFILRLITD